LIRQLADWSKRINLPAITQAKVTVGRKIKAVGKLAKI